MLIVLYIQVDYHLYMGVSKFYVYDDSGHLPDERASLVLQDLIDSGVVQWEDVSRGRCAQGKQMKRYAKCINEHRHEHDWLAIIDADEFIVIDDHAKTIPDMLANYTQAGGTKHALQ
jgi:Glycosyltransferase family 92